MPSLGGWEWVILAVVALVLFGGTKLAGFGKSAGQAIREFKEETKSAPEVEPPAAAAPAPVPEPQPEPQVSPQATDDGPSAS